MRVVCSTISEYEKHSTTLTYIFKERGYLKSLLKEQVSKVSTTNRKNVLSSKRLKSIQKAEAYLESKRASTMEFFCEHLPRYIKCHWQ